MFKELKEHTRAAHFTVFLQREKQSIKNIKTLLCGNQLLANLLLFVVVLVTKSQPKSGDKYSLIKVHIGN
jgi:hypothetical protein